jgi:hypothetical protein
MICPLELAPNRDAWSQRHRASSARRSVGGRHDRRLAGSHCSVTQCWANERTSRQESPENHATRRHRAWEGRLAGRSRRQRVTRAPDIQWPAIQANYLGGKQCQPRSAIVLGRAARPFPLSRLQAPAFRGLPVAGGVVPTAAGECLDVLEDRVSKLEAGVPSLSVEQFGLHTSPNDSTTSLSHPAATPVQLACPVPVK